MKCHTCKYERALDEPEHRFYRSGERKGELKDSRMLPVRDGWRELCLQGSFGLVIATLYGCPECGTVRMQTAALDSLSGD